MENKYFTPDIEDVYVGYELEWKCKIRNQDWEKTICDTDLISIIYDEYEHADFEEPYNEQFRVPYLTKEQIEAEGWKENVLNNNEKALLLFLKNGYELRMYKNYICRFSILIVGAGIIPNWDKVLFEGKCKDINTFRKICKLLEIY